MESVFSDHWHRVADLHPRMRPGVRVDRQWVRGELWYLVGGGDSGQSHRLNPAAWNFVGRCDGQQSVQAIWDALLEQRPEDAPTQDDVVDLLSRLYEHGIVDAERAPDVRRLVEQQRSTRRRERAGRLNPLSLRLRLGDPSRLLARSGTLSRLLFGPLGLVLWLACCTAGALTALTNIDGLLAHGARWMDSPRYALLAWLCYPFVKLVHEAGHALATRRWGGEVREAGLSFFLLFPMPYVDASDANRFGRRRERTIVSAAGILSELAIAALAVLTWSVLEPGLARDVAFTCAFICGVSTVVFNANPLMRMDGYFMLCDALALPNLAARSGAFWTNLMGRSLLGVRDLPPMPIAPGEKPWLVAYAPMAWTYRVALAYWMVFWAGGVHPLLGFVVGVLAGVWLLALPAGMAITRATRMAPDGRGRATAQRRLVASLAAVAAFIGLVPMPDRLVAQGVVWAPEQSDLRAEGDGFLQPLSVSAGAVTAGQVVGALEDMALEAERQRLTARRKGLETAVYQSLVNEPASSRQYQEEITSIDRQLANIGQRQASLTVRAPVSGQLALVRPEDLPGRFFKRGERIGQVLEPRPPVIRVALPQQDIARLADGTTSLSVRLAERRHGALQGTLVRDAPVMVDRLPSAALGDRAGGEIVVDPADKDGTRPISPVYIVDVELPEGGSARIGARAWVRFGLGSAPLAVQWAQALRQQVLARFSPFET